MTQFGPGDHTHFMVDFQQNMLGDSININSLNCNPVVLKRNGKTSNKYDFWIQFVQNRGQYVPHPIQKTDKLSKTFYQNAICFG